MPPKSKRSGAATARKAPGARGQMGRAPVVEEMKEAPAEEVKVAEEAPKVVEEPKRQPFPLLPQQPVVEEKGSDAAANGANRGEGIVSAPISCIGRRLLL